MTATPALTTALQRQVLLLEDDLRERLAADPERTAAWRTEHGHAVHRGRTAMAWQAWRDDRITQAAVSWVLTTVFVRFCEDNGLVGPVWIAGPPHRRREAVDAQLAYFRAEPEHTDREWLLQAVGHLASLPATAGLVDAHSALHLVAPSGHAAAGLLKFWRETPVNGQGLVHDLTDPSLSTRFLGDLYQDLSVYAKATFALLQTPVFVEEFILDRTLEPALAERPLEGFRMIDPTCGSGHFLLGSFDRLLDRWQRHAPAMDSQALVQQALDAIHGVDLNPFAVAIARFRLTVAAMAACDLRSLEAAPAFRFHLAVGDSLLHGPGQQTLAGDADLSGFAYATEDLAALQTILAGGRYDVVVGNPPYIQPPDEQARNNYRRIYKICKGKYSLVAPFLERIFQLCRSGARVGVIVGNSFMTRVFGGPVVDFLRRKQIDLVLDTKNLNLAGHGTPTVILIGRQMSPVAPVRVIVNLDAAVGPASGKSPAWRALLSAERGDETAKAQATPIPADMLWQHPVVLMPAAERLLLRRLSQVPATLCAVAGDPGLSFVTGEEEAYLRPASWMRTRGKNLRLRALIDGVGVRDWQITAGPSALIFPYTEAGEPVHSPPVLRELWPQRQVLASTLYFGKRKEERDLAWFEYAFLSRSRVGAARLAYPLVTDYAHFVALPAGAPYLLDHSAPTAVLAAAGLEDVVALNASTSWFWMKRTFFAKGHDDPEQDFHEVDATKARLIPLITDVRPGVVRRLLATPNHVDASVPATEIPDRNYLEDARERAALTRMQAVSAQEELDWEVYRFYGLVDEDLNYMGDDLPGLALGERAFEIALARKVVAGEQQTGWFARHGTVPVTDIPAHWPVAYRELVRQRIEVIARVSAIGLLEKPEHKRRWASEPWEKQQERALRDWLLDRLEGRRFWFDPHGRPWPRSVAQLADDVARDGDLVGVLALWEGRRDVPIAASLVRLLADQAVPYLAAYRYKDSGLRKREAWEETWALQRREDAGEAVGPIPVPPKYTSADFRSNSYWQARGKLDVPKERFVLYPDAGRETDPTPLLGWAGWDHAQQALALNLILGEREAEGWADERLVPLVAGLAELQPWVEQWHSGLDRDSGVDLAAFCREELETRSRQVGRTRGQLAAWRPEPARRGRRRQDP